MVHKQRNIDMKTLLKTLAFGSTALLLVSCGYNESLEQDKIRIERQREDLNKRAEWFQSLTTAEQDSVKLLYGWDF